MLAGGGGSWVEEAGENAEEDWRPAGGAPGAGICTAPATGTAGTGLGSGSGAVGGGAGGGVLGEGVEEDEAMAGGGARAPSWGAAAGAAGAAAVAALGHLGLGSLVWWGCWEIFFAFTLLLPLAEQHR